MALDPGTWWCDVGSRPTLGSGTELASHPGTTGVVGSDGSFSSLRATTRQKLNPMSSSEHAVDRSTSAAAEHHAIRARRALGGVGVQFLATEDGLRALQLNAPVPLAISLLDVLHRLGVVLTAFEVQTGGAQQEHRFAVTELDGTAIRGARLQLLQAEILTVVKQTRGQRGESPG